MNDHQTDLIQQLRARGQRLTPQRRLVLEVLEQSDHHVSVDEIAQAISRRYPSISVDHTTIYRTLKWLRDADLVGETSLGQGHMVYALLSHHDHHHLVCEQCHATIEVDPTILDPVREELERRYGFAARLAHISIFGLCRRCRA